MKKEFTEVVGYEGLYIINKTGNIISLNYARMNIMKELKYKSDKDGYIVVGMTKDKRVKWEKVHRLVAKTFIPNPNNYPCVNHKDENPSNNNVDNLEWCTHKYNNNYGNHPKKLSITNSKRWDNKEFREKQSKRMSNYMKQKCSNADYIETKIEQSHKKEVYQYDLNKNFIKKWNSAHDIERITGYYQSSISGCCNGRIKTSYGFIWSHNML